MLIAHVGSARLAATGLSDSHHVHPACGGILRQEGVLVFALPGRSQYGPYRTETDSSVSTHSIDIKWWDRLSPWACQIFAQVHPVYVSSARDSKHGLVAIKFSHPSHIEREFAILRQLKEAGVPGVAHVYGRCHFFPFHGITLQLFSKNLAALGKMELEEVALMGKGMVRAEPVFLRPFATRPFQVFTLQSVHNIGIIHNDIKPENIVTSDRHSFYLIDWDAARGKTDRTPILRIGTPLYMSVRTLRGGSK